MKIQRNPQLAESLLSQFSAADFQDRSDQHPSVTDLIYCLTNTYYKYRNNQDAKAGLVAESPKPTAKTQVMYFIGLGLERALLSGIRGSHEGPSGEFDGIFFHADSFVDGNLFELKSTRLGKKGIDATVGTEVAVGTEPGLPVMWVRQCLSYCKALGVNEVDLGVVFVIPGDLEVYHITFSKEEVAQHWWWMLERKRIWDTAIETGVEPEPFKHNLDWECDAYGGCQWKLACTLRASLSALGVPNGGD